MKTLHLTNAYHESSGGIRTAYQALLAAGNREGRDVVLVVPGQANEVVQVGAHGRVYHVRAPHAPAFDRRYRVLLPHRYLPLVPSRLVDILERERPDLVEISDKYALPYLAAMLRKHWHRRAGRPTLIGLSCERFDDNMSAYLSPSPAAHQFTRWYIRTIYGPPFDHHIANSAYTADELRRSLYDRDPGFIRVCPPGVDTAAFGPGRRSAAVRRALLEAAGGTERSVLLFYAGRLSPEKNVGLLVDTLEALVAAGDRDYRLAVAGDGPLAAWLREQALGRLGGRLTLCGVLGRASLADHYASCDVFVHPNPREPFGIGPLEAMASGVPVVAPASGGVLEYAGDDNAWLTAPDGASFAAAVRRAAVGDPMRVAAALRTALAFDAVTIGRRQFALYDELHRARLDGERPRPWPTGTSVAARVAFAQQFSS